MPFDLAVKLEEFLAGLVGTVLILAAAYGLGHHFGYAGALAEFNNQAAKESVKIETKVESASKKIEKEFVAKDAARAETRKSFESKVNDYAGEKHEKTCDGVAVIDDAGVQLINSAVKGRPGGSERGGPSSVQKP